MISNIILAAMINTGTIHVITDPLSGDALNQMEGVIDTLVTTPSYVFLVGGVERIFAVILHISLSVLVWFAAKKKGKFYLFPLAIFIHLFVDAATVLLSRKDAPIPAIEAIIGILALLTALLASYIYKKETPQGNYSKEGLAI